jgi:hypothetical protein
MRRANTAKDKPGTTMTRFFITGIAALLLATGTAHAREPDYICDKGLRVYVGPYDQIVIRMPRAISAKIEINLRRWMGSKVRHGYPTWNTIIDNMSVDGNGCKMKE